MKRLTYDEQAALFGVLAHPERLRILDVLAEGEACVCHLSGVLRQRQAYMSQQLGQLKEAGLIVDRRDGLFVYYSLADASITDLLRETRQRLAQMAGDESFVQAEPHLRVDKKCPCPRCQAARLLAAGKTAVATAAG